MGIFSDSDELKACKAKCKAEEDARESAKPQESFFGNLYTKITSLFASPAAPSSQLGGKRRRKTQRGGFSPNEPAYGADAASVKQSGGKRRKGRKGTRKQRK